MDTFLNLLKYIADSKKSSDLDTEGVKKLIKNETKDIRTELKNDVKDIEKKLEEQLITDEVLIMTLNPDWYDKEYDDFKDFFVFYLESDESQQILNYTQVLSYLMRGAPVKYTASTHRPDQIFFLDSYYGYFFILKLPTVKNLFDFTYDLIGDPGAWGILDYLVFRQEGDNKCTLSIPESARYSLLNRGSITLRAYGGADIFAISAILPHRTKVSEEQQLYSMTYEEYGVLLELIEDKQINVSLRLDLEDNGPIFNLVEANEEGMKFSQTYGELIDGTTETIYAKVGFVKNNNESTSIYKEVVKVLEKPEDYIEEGLNNIGVALPYSHTHMLEGQTVSLIKKQENEKYSEYTALIEPFGDDMIYLSNFLYHAISTIPGYFNYSISFSDLNEEQSDYTDIPGLNEFEDWTGEESVYFKPVKQFKSDFNNYDNQILIMTYQGSTNLNTYTLYTIFFVNDNNKCQDVKFFVKKEE